MMKQISILLALAVSCLFLLSACASVNDHPASSIAEDSAVEESTPGEAYHQITAEEAKQMLDEGGVTVVDVRTAEEYAEQHIPGAVLVPNESIGDEPPAELPDQDAVLLVHCRTGVRSKQASDKLIKLGYTQVYDFGGIVDWPYETESGEPSR